MLEDGATLLFVDDDDAARQAFRRTILCADLAYDLRHAANVSDALDILRSQEIDLVITDIHMPGGDGFALLERLRGSPNTRSIPVIMITGAANDDSKIRALYLGATDLLIKPVDARELLARIQLCLSAREQELELASQSHSLRQMLDARTDEIESLRLEVIWRLAKVIECRDEYTGHHVVRVGCYANVISKALGQPTPFSDLILQAAPLHDLGKIGIPDSLLLKAGPLTQTERRMMEEHCRIGADMLRQDSALRRVSARLAGRKESMMESRPHPGLHMAAIICLTHHERWDGSGYPEGLKANAIPLEGRIVAICDAYDALRSQRPYKSAFEERTAYSMICNSSGSQFDPGIISAFEGTRDEFDRIWNELKDESHDRMQNSEVHDAIAICG